MQLHRPVWPGQRLVLVERWLRQDLELDAGRRALPKRRSDAVGSRVPATDDDNPLAERVDLTRRRRLLAAIAGTALVLLGQEIHREVDSGKLASRYWQVARLFRPASEDERVVVVEKPLHRDSDANLHVRAENDAFGLHLGDTPVDDGVGEIDVGHSVTK